MTNTLIQSHCLHILKRCLKDFEFEDADEQLDVDNFSDISGKKGWILIMTSLKTLKSIITILKV